MRTGYVWLETFRQLRHEVNAGKLYAPDAAVEILS